MIKSLNIISKKTYGFFRGAHFFWQNIPANTQRLYFFCRSIMPWKGKSIAKTDSLIQPEIGNSIQAIFNGHTKNFTLEENALLEKIEKLRTALSSSLEQIEFKDFGAGSAASPEDTQVAQAGVKRQRTVSEICKRSSKSPKYARILFSLIRAAKPANCIELGTCLGISAAYEGNALKLNGTGQLTTIEGAAPLAQLAQNNISALGLEKQVTIVNEVFAAELDRLVKKAVPIDYLFIDGHHDGPATIQYYKTLEPLLTLGAIVIFDDIFYSKSMYDAWKSIRQYDCWQAIGTSEQLGIGIYSKVFVKQKVSFSF